MKAAFVHESYMCTECGEVLIVLASGLPIPDRVKALHRSRNGSCPNEGKQFWVPILVMPLEEAP